MTPDGSKVYVANYFSATVSVIDTATNTVIGGPIPVGAGASGVAVTSDGSKVYVANYVSNTVSVIDTATNTVIGGPIPVGTGPFAVSIFTASLVVPPVVSVPIHNRCFSGLGSNEIWCPRLNVCLPPQVYKDVCLFTRPHP